ncbi:hypothetical protein MMU07_04635 [Aquiflexum sp. LQ15W]|uniref:hypothetical protein n=1 Tax=Cognataquiflexum nitidum TaxID=2922272 RepID=UPI001F13A4F2|nr:hypothetical protein [Cognataquiflexum nitidum]MCH6198851.1 hypothetical protein [Cognataquiflexum nitidum]
MWQFRLIVFFAIFCCSCKSHVFFEDLYARKSSREKYFRRDYVPVEATCIFQGRVCHDIDIPGLPQGITNSRIFFDHDSITSLISIAFSEAFPGSSLNQVSGISNWRHCDYVGKDLSGIFDLPSSFQSQACNRIVYLQLQITTQTGKRIEGGGGLEWAEDMGDDRHLIEYKLITSIYQNDTLIYMDNRAYWTRVASARGEQLHYQVPQEVIDTLVKLSLEEYFKRMK